MVNLIYFLYKVWYLDQGIFVSGFCFCLFMFNWSSTICFLLYLIAFTIFVKNQLGRASLMAQQEKNLPVIQDTWVRLLGQEGSLEQEMATRSSILAWKIPWTKEHSRLRSREVAKSWTPLSMMTALRWASILKVLFTSCVIPGYLLKIHGL